MRGAVLRNGALVLSGLLAELVELLEKSRQSEGNSVVISEQKHADPAAFGGQVMNTHSGGHYMPEFNRYWAEKILELLRRQNIILE